MRVVDQRIAVIQAAKELIENFIGSWSTVPLRNLLHSRIEDQESDDQDTVGRNDELWVEHHKHGDTQTEHAEKHRPAGDPLPTIQISVVANDAHGPANLAVTSVGCSRHETRGEVRESHTTLGCHNQDVKRNPYGIRLDICGEVRGRIRRVRSQGEISTKERQQVSATQSSPDLSVVIVSWNTRDLLLRCLHSIRSEENRSRLSVETIVVDNASSDGTPEVVSSNWSNVRLLAQRQNLGFATANNIGIEQSHGRGVLILNPDTELRPDSLSILWRTLNAAQHIGLVAPVLLNTDGSFQSAGFQFPGLVQTMLDLYPLHPRLVGSGLNGRFDRGDGLTPFRIDHPLGACMLVRRDVIEDVGPFDPGYFIYSEEVDWCRRITDAGWTILCAPSAEVIHHGGQSTSQAPDRMRLQLHRSRAKYLYCYHPESFHRVLRGLMSAGIALKRVGIPLPTDGRTPDDLAEIAEIYERAAQEMDHV
jgi:N-acetylglucosaminyl-diphospho-decaprenol L-rhamnosyltransferase